MLRDLPVRDLMVTEVVTFRPEDNVQDAMRAMVGRGIHGAPVIDEGRHVVGVLTIGDLIVEEARLHFPTIVNLFGVNVAIPWHDRELDNSVAKALGEFVHEVMTENPVSIHAEDTIEDAATLMHDKQVSRLPVVDNAGRLVGLLTRMDILRAMVRGLDDPAAYDAGDQSPESLGEGVPLAGELTGPGGPGPGTAASEGSPSVHPAAADDTDFGADVGRI
jgi:CBS domain-containing protein